KEAYYKLVVKTKNLIMAKDASLMSSLEETIVNDRKDIAERVAGMEKLFSREDRAKYLEIRALFTKFLAMHEKLYRLGNHDTAGEAFALAQKDGRAALRTMADELRQLRDAIAAQPRSPENASASAAVSEVLVFLHDVTAEERNLMLETSDAGADASVQRMKTLLANVSAQREM